MSYRIHESWTRALIHEPETGMGYQVVEVPLGKYAEHAIVLNGRQALETNETPSRFREGASKIRQEHAHLVLISEFKETRINVLSRREAIAKGLIEGRAYKAGRGAATEAAAEQSKENEEFRRFSAFPDDIRILADGSVTPGTYVTTAADAAHVATGKEAVERYALPNPDPATHRFYLKPPAPIQVRRGTVQPANGRQGGGDEVIFDNGAPPKTRYKQDQIPPGD